jgi:hypothetical protein
MSIELINYVKIMRQVSGHLEPSSGGILFRAIKYWIVTVITNYKCGYGLIT